MEAKKARMQELIQVLNEAAKVYYQGQDELMSNYEYDQLYDELTALEEQTGIIMAASPTIHVGYEVLSELPKEEHESPMLSLDKTKEITGLQEFAKEQPVLVSWKLDGLTIVLTYREGRLVKAVTRGNGEIGEVVTSNAKVFKNLPLQIAFQGELILRGEAVIGYQDFEKINEQMEETAKYKNPRNLCSGSVRQLNSEITAERNVAFFAFGLVRAVGVDFENSRKVQLEWLKKQGFAVVEYRDATQENMAETVAYFAQAIEQNDYPSDGLVAIYDDIEYGVALGTTAKFPRDSIAFKWADEKKESTLLEIEWSPSRTGLINPVAIFEPVELEGTTVARASVHNISVMEELELGIGDHIEIYKANMIIPQIAENLTRSGTVQIPTACPVCGGDTEIRQVNNARSLYCGNEACQVKQIKSFALFVSRNALNIEGLSEATLEKFVTQGIVAKYRDLFHLEEHREQICEMEGFGERSYENLVASAKKAKTTTLPRVIYGLGIANIGLANAKLICKAFDYDIDRILAATEEQLDEIPGIGTVIAQGFGRYFADQERQQEVRELLDEFQFPDQSEVLKEQELAGIQFVITGKVEEFSNRSEMKEVIEAKGGKVTGSVTSKTNYLINNDLESSSSKNKKARELEVPIISEVEFIRLFCKEKLKPV